MKELDSDDCLELLDDVKKRIREKKDFIVAVDGFNGTGKSTLSNRIGNETSARVIHLDNFLLPQWKKYVTEIDYEKLIVHLVMLKSNNGPIIIEGCCLLEVLSDRRLKQGFDYLIYCKKISEGSRIWHDGDFWINRDFYENKPLPKYTGLRAQIFKYSENYRPWERADCVFNLINQHKT